MYLTHSGLLFHVKRQLLSRYMFHVKRQLLSPLHVSRETSIVAPRYMFHVKRLIALTIFYVKLLCFIKNVSRETQTGYFLSPAVWRA